LIPILQLSGGLLESLSKLGEEILAEKILSQDWLKVICVEKYNGKYYTTHNQTEKIMDELADLLDNV
jgi:hypothetical protein